MKVCAEIIIFCLFLQLTCCFESNLCEEKSQQKTSEDFKFLQEENKALRSELEKLKEARSSPLTRRKRQICDDAGHTSRLEKQVVDCLDTNRGFQTSINELEATLNSISASQPKNCPTTAPVQPIVQPNCQAHTRRLKEINENLLSEVFNKFGPTYSGGKQKTFFISRDKHLNWASAATYCEDRGMNLATFDSYNEGVYFDGVSKYSTWIGVRDNIMNGEFVRVTDGKNIKSFVPWRSGQPSGHEFCVHSWDGHNFNDLSCNSHLRFACETVE